MRSVEAFLAAVAALVLLAGPVGAQTVLGTPSLSIACEAGDDADYFTPRITEPERGSGVPAGCAEALALAPESRISITAEPWNDLERRIDRLALMPSGDGPEPLFIVTGDDRSLILGARGSLGDFSVGGYFTYPRPEGGTDADRRGPGSYGLGAAYESDDWWVGLAYRRLGEARLDLRQPSEPLDAIELSGQYQFGSGINLQGSLGYTERRFTGTSRPERDDNGWYIVGTVKIPF